MADKKQDPVKRDTEKTPLPPSLFLPVEFWAHIVSTVDYKAKELSRLYGYGKVSVTFKIHRGRVSDVFFSDSAQLKNMFDKEKENLTKKPKS